MHSFSLALPTLLLGVALGQEGTVEPTAGSSINTETRCDNFLSGVQRGNICCNVWCGECGGTGCATRQSWLTPEDCCMTVIEDSGVMCGDSQVAPCIVDDVFFGPDPTDPPAETAEEMVTEEVVEGSDDTSMTTEEDDLLVGVDDPAYDEPVNRLRRCDNKLNGVQGDGACCNVHCGTCGGDGCETRNGLTPEQCCSDTIIESGIMCGDSMVAPCIVDDVVFGDYPYPTPYPESATMTTDMAEEGEEEVMAAPEPTAAFSVNTRTRCDNFLSGVQEGDACCNVWCGECGGDDCATRVSWLGAEDCCVEEIMTSEIMCGESEVAPCIVDSVFFGPNPTDPALATTVEELVETGDEIGDASTAEPSLVESSEEMADADTVEPTAEFSVNTRTLCTNDISGVQEGDACCSVWCGTCGGDDCATRVSWLGAEDCCVDEIMNSGVMCSADGVAPCIVDDSLEERHDEPTSDPTWYQGTCDNGLSGVQEGDVCCNVWCGTCGTDDCENRQAFLTGADCCTDQIMDSGKMCSEEPGVAPCIIDDA